MISGKERAAMGARMKSGPTGTTRMPWRRYLSCLRYRDIVVLQGSPLMGVAFTLGEVTLEKIVSLFLFSLASFLLVAHIFCFNDWAGIASDSKDPNKAKEVFLTKGITRREVGALSLFLGLFSLALFSLLPFRTLLLAVGILLLGLFYSFYAKGIPVVSSCVHLIGGVLHFLLGYSLFGGIGRRGVLIGLYFALTFVAGHLNQEVRDYEGDRLNGILTNGVRFGKRKTFLAGFLLFTLSYGHLVFLAHSGLVLPQLRYLIGLYPVHVVLSWRTLRAGLTFQSVSRFQASYRALYALIGLSMGATLLL